MGRRQAASPETKAAAIAELLTGNAIAYVARTHHVSPTTVRRWRDASGIVVATERVQKTDLSELIVEYVSAALHTLTAQVATFRDPQWLQAQSAAELAQLHGVIADKVFRVLAAMEAGREADRSGSYRELGPGSASLDAAGESASAER